MTPEEEAKLRQKASTEAVWELIQDLVNNVAALRADNAVLRKKLEETTVVE